MRGVSDHGKRIAMLIEGRTEDAFIPHLRKYLEKTLADRMPRIKTVRYDGGLPKESKLYRVVQRLTSGSNCFDAVIALSDVYTGSNDFVDADDAKLKMKTWVENDPRFFPHVAKHDFEAWLLPYWASIQKLAGHNMKSPSGNPENVNHSKPPSKYLIEIFEIGTAKRSYNKPRDANRILRDNGLDLAVSKCPELKSLINTIIKLSEVQVE